MTLDPAVVTGLLTAGVTAIVSLGGAYVLWVTKLSKAKDTTSAQVHQQRIDDMQQIYAGYQKLHEQTLEQVADGRKASAEQQSRFTATLTEIQRRFLEDTTNNRKDWMEMVQRLNEDHKAVLMREREFFAVQLGNLSTIQTERADRVVKQMETMAAQNTTEHRAMLDGLREICRAHPQHEEERRGKILRVPPESGEG